jgi:hypothetical protein
MEVAKTLHEKISKFCQVTLDSCAYAGTGNVLKVLIFVFCLAGQWGYYVLREATPFYDIGQNTLYLGSFFVPCNCTCAVMPECSLKEGVRHET